MRSSCGVWRGCAPRDGRGGECWCAAAGRGRRRLDGCESLGVWDLSATRGRASPSWGLASTPAVVAVLVERGGAVLFDDRVSESARASLRGFARAARGPSQAGRLRGRGAWFARAPSRPHQQYLLNTAWLRSWESSHESSWLAEALTALRLFADS